MGCIIVKTQSFPQCPNINLKYIMTDFQIDFCLQPSSPFNVNTVILPALLI